MKRHVGSLMVWIALAAVCIPTLGCGTSDGDDNNGTTTGATPGTTGPSLTNAVFNGTYLVTSFSTRFDPAMPANRDYDAEVGEMLANGIGSWAQLPGSNDNDDGAVTVGMASAAVPYTVAPDGTLTLLPGFTTGGISSDGATAVSAPNNALLDPLALLLMRISGVGMSNASLAGSYHLAQLYGRAGGSNPTALWTSNAAGFGPLVANGMPAGSWVVPAMNLNSAGATTMIPAPGAAPYNVTASGRMTGSLLNGNYTGALSSDGAFAILGGGTVAAQDPQIAVMVKASLLLTNAAFSGNYWAVGLSSDPTNMNRWTSFVGSVTADGAGNMNFVSTTEALETDAGGSTISTPSGTDTYMVAGDGSLTTPGGRIGAITADGRFAYLSGSATVGDGPLLFVFIRK